MEIMEIWQEKFTGFSNLFFSGSGELEFEEFCILAARFLIEEDEEQMRKELKEAFRFYDKEGILTANMICASRSDLIIAVLSFIDC